ncbi:hypothetical protein OH492_14445 [Vibrio chagasii]|nr:hypothetical protein [Vibrio chagasii]
MVACDLYATISNSGGGVATFRILTNRDGVLSKLGGSPSSYCACFYVARVDHLAGHDGDLQTC